MKVLSPSAAVIILGAGVATWVVLHSLMLSATFFGAASSHTAAAAAGSHLDSAGHAHRRRVVPAEPEEDDSGACMKKYPEIAVDGKCEFDGCKGDHYVYVLTSYRNRGASYNRWLRTLAADVQSDANKSIPPECFCSAVADYNDMVYGPTVQAALEDWPYSSVVVNVSDAFSRAGGFQILLENVVHTEPEKSLVFFMDADMIAYPGLMERVHANTIAGQQAFAPVCWSTNHTPEDWYDGYWRISGTGMMAFYFSDFVKLGGCIPMADRTTYGKEDHEFTMLLSTKSGASLVRECTPELWHLYHSKKSWGWTLDGVTRAKYTGVNPWDPNEPWKSELPHSDGPQELEKRKKIGGYHCSRVRHHTYAR